MKIAEGTVLKLPEKPSAKAKHFLSLDNSMAKPEEIWTEYSDLHNGKKVFTADVDVISMYKELGKLPKIGKTFVIPHPTHENECLNANEFGEVQEQHDMYGDINAEAWELDDADVHLILIKKA